MCWSATADLVAGTAVTGVGVACVARARGGRDLPLAALPLLLGVHQIVEAVVWESGGGRGPATMVWAVIALPLLAVWVPAGVLCVAPPHARRRLVLPLAVGAATAAVLAYGLVTAPVTAEIREHTVRYGFGLSHAALLVAGYLLATVGSLLLSGDRRLLMLGVLAALGAFVCWALWRLEFVSTWCAYAAVCSVVLFRWVRARPDPGRTAPDPAARTPGRRTG
ncbi:DUF6629 family protein [Streptomyces sp. ALI-76-A]|jgi:hypothetical protein|uniref:DUF6629 family protein n=1 Tax=Streptomyces sp. ALI-76-A TaxID=3025736 RepID=UPI00256F2154|nr:DUF6629 family protein [Streptomyces sp. ALI-76-A]MDL5205712.1 hypothetical protein [Streptomyces sp. ALI-76-A]